MHHCIRVSFLKRMKVMTDKNTSGSSFYKKLKTPVQQSSQKTSQPLSNNSISSRQSVTDGSELVDDMVSSAEKSLEKERSNDVLHLFKRVKVGRTNVLRVVKRLPFGAYLSPGSNKKSFDLEEILLPKRYEPENLKVDDLLKVFIYFDSEDRIIATTEKPLAQVDECAFLKVVDVNKVGAFLDMGLMKDLFVPYAEQEMPMKVGESYVVHLYLDEHSGRIMASSKLDKFLIEESHYHKEGQAVDLLIYAESELGYKAVIGSTYQGLLFKNEVFQTLKIGDKIKGFIKEVRGDKKINLSLQLASEKTRGSLANQILHFIKNQGGTSKLTDKSPPEEIYQQFKVSKKSYKKALGALYKRKLILIEKDKISLVD